MKYIWYSPQKSKYPEVHVYIVFFVDKKKCIEVVSLYGIFIGLSHIRVSTHVSTAYRDTKGTSHVRRRYVGIRSSYSSIRSSYSSYAEVLRFFMCALKNS